MDMNIMNFDIGWIWLLSDLDINVKDGYECYEFDMGIWSGY